MQGFLCSRLRTNSSVTTGWQRASCVWPTGKTGRKEGVACSGNAFKIAVWECPWQPSNFAAVAKAAEQTRRNEEILVAHAAGKTAAALAKQFGLSKSRISLYFR